MTSARMILDEWIYVNLFVFDCGFARSKTQATAKPDGVFEVPKRRNFSTFRHHSPRESALSSRASMAPERSVSKRLKAWCDRDAKETTWNPDKSCMIHQNSHTCQVRLFIWQGSRKGNSPEWNCRNSPNIMDPTNHFGAFHPYSLLPTVTCCQHQTRQPVQSDPIPRVLSDLLLLLIVQALSRV